MQVALDFALDVGAASETVNVTGTAPLLNASNADLGQVINSTYLSEVGIDVHNGRNVINLARLAPGVCALAGGCTDRALVWTFTVARDPEEAAGDTSLPRGFAVAPQASFPPLAKQE